MEDDWGNIIVSDEDSDDYDDYTAQECKRPGGIPPRIQLTMTREEIEESRYRAHQAYLERLARARIARREQRSKENRAITKSNGKKKKNGNKKQKLDDENNDNKYDKDDNNDDDENENGSNDDNNHAVNNPVSNSVAVN